VWEPQCQPQPVRLRSGQWQQERGAGGTSRCEWVYVLVIRRGKVGTPNLARLRSRACKGRCEKSAGTLQETAGEQPSNESAQEDASSGALAWRLGREMATMLTKSRLACGTIGAGAALLLKRLVPSSAPVWRTRPRLWTQREARRRHHPGTHWPKPCGIRRRVAETEGFSAFSQRYRDPILG
jgi:hypothetical protein